LIRRGRRSTGSRSGAQRIRVERSPVQMRVAVKSGQSPLKSMVLRVWQAMTINGQKWQKVNF
jgi:hypothetical protein